MKKTDPIADNMAKAIKQLLGTSIFRTGYTNRTSVEYNKARTAVSDALNDYEMALNSPAPIDWGHEHQSTIELREKAASYISSAVGDWKNKTFISPIIAIAHGESILYGGLQDSRCAVFTNPGGLVLLASVSETGYVFKDVPIIEIDTEALLLIAAEVQKAIQ